MQLERGIWVVLAEIDKDLTKLSLEKIEASMRAWEAG